MSVFLGRVVAPGDPMWLEEDTEAALEWLRWQQRVCVGCSQPKDESFDPDGPSYNAEVLRCRACEAKDAKSDDFRSNKGNVNGIYFSVSPADSE